MLLKSDYKSKQEYSNFVVALLKSKFSYIVQNWSLSNWEEKNAQNIWYSFKKSHKNLFKSHSYFRENKMSIPTLFKSVYKSKQELIQIL